MNANELLSIIEQQSAVNHSLTRFFTGLLKAKEDPSEVKPGADQLIGALK